MVYITTYNKIKLKFKVFEAGNLFFSELVLANGNNSNDTPSSTCSPPSCSSCASVQWLSQPHLMKNLRKETSMGLPRDGAPLRQTVFNDRYVVGVILCFLHTSNSLLLSKLLPRGCGRRFSSSSWVRRM